MWGLIVSSSNFSYSTVSCHNYNRCLITFESSIQIREAFYVQHVNFVDKKYTWDDFSSTLFTPLCNFLIDLLSNFRFNFTNISCKKCHEALGSRIYDVDFVKSDSVNNFFSFLQLTLWALNKSSLGTNIVIVTAAGK